MPRSLVLAAAAVVFATPALATCLDDAAGAQCDVFLEDYRAADVPVGTSMIWPERQFLVEGLDRDGLGTGVETVLGDNVFYWDGSDAHVVTESSGAQFKIADW